MPKELKTKVLNIDLAISFAEKKFSVLGKKNHFLRVLVVLRDEFNINDQELLIAVVLHDTLEDTDTTYDELVRVFSKNVADLVQEVSHSKNYKDEDKLQYYNQLKTISPRAKIIKLADFVDNLRSIIHTRKSDPKSLYHNGYIVLIRGFLETCPESNAKKMVYELTKELEKYVTV